jgi:hypothetical protein
MTEKEILTLEVIGEGAIEFPIDSPLLQVAKAASEEAERLQIPWFFSEILWEELERDIAAMKEFAALCDAMWDDCDCCGAVLASDREE